MAAYDTVVAVGTEEPPYFTCVMIVVNCQPSAEDFLWPLANEALAVLVIEHLVILFKTNAIGSAKVPFTGSLFFIQGASLSQRMLLQI